MSKGFEVRSYDYVNHPYDEVRAALTKDGLKIFHEATKVATSRADSLVAALSINISGIEVSSDISISVKKTEESARQVSSPPTTRIELEWKAAKLPRLFPFMRAELAVYPLTKSETQLEFSGQYEAPLGALGAAINTVIGHRIAEACVHRFLENVATYLKATLAAKT